MQPVTERPLRELVSSIICPDVGTQVDQTREHKLSTSMEIIRCIRSGLKALYVAPYEGKYRSIQVGQKITFSNWGRTITCRVVTKKVYVDFAALLEKENVVFTQSHLTGRLIAMRLEKLPIKTIAVLKFSN